MNIADVNIHENVFWWTYVCVFSNVKLTLYFWSKQHFLWYIILFMCCWVWFSRIGFRMVAFMSLKEISLQFSIPLISMWSLSIEIPWYYKKVDKYVVFFLLSDWVCLVLVLFFPWIFRRIFFLAQLLMGNSSSLLDNEVMKIFNLLFYQFKCFFQNILSTYF
jgi:hypothetical protein